MTGEMRTSVDIDATPELVWEVLTDVPPPRSGHPLITKAGGTFAPGGG